jgi:hypothetical protein
MKTIADGLDHAQIFHEKTPEEVLRWLKETFNAFHSGASSTFLEYIRDCQRVHAGWRSHCETANITARTCGKGEFSYGNLLKEYVQRQDPKKFGKYVYYDKTLSLSNNLIRMEVFDNFAATMHAEVRFTAKAFDNLLTLANLHSLMTSIIIPLVEPVVGKYIAGQHHPTT